MANRVEFSVTATPIVSGTISEGEGTVDLIASDMPKSLGGSGAVTSGETSPSVTVDFTTTTGYSSGTVAYKNVVSATPVSLVDATTIDFLVVKHTGFQYSSATVLSSTASTGAVYLSIYDDDQGGVYIIAVLRPGECVVLPCRAKAGASGSVRQFQVALANGTTSVALEYFTTT